jgi:hypothetical protein
VYPWPEIDPDERQIYMPDVPRKRSSGVTHTAVNLFSMKEFSFGLFVPEP